MRHLISFLLLALFLSGCSSQTIIRDKEYEPALNAFSKGDYRETLAQFPLKESGGFITSVEKSWIGFWNGDTSEPVALQNQVNTFENRKFLSLHREAGYFFYQEDEEGYVPSEHEVIVLHLMSAMAYMRNKKWDDARVEARRAGYYLQGLFNENQPHFDDPSLRIWLASIWAALGDWPEAQVDLRRAYEITKDKKLLPYLQMQTAPPQMSLVMYGVAPVLKWSPSASQPEFKIIDTEDDWQFGTFKNDPSNMFFSTSGWYARHTQRNGELRSVLLKSNYMAQFMAVESKTLAQRAGTKMMSGSVKFVGVVVGAVVAGAGLYVLASAGGGGGGELAGAVIGLGYVMGRGIWDEGKRFERKAKEELDAQEKSDLEQVHNYRLVRFLPEEIVLSFSNGFENAGTSRIQLRAPGSQTVSRFIHVPR